MDMLPFIPVTDGENTVFNVEQIPKEMDIFLIPEDHFLPDGKDFEDLTPAEEKRLISQYRFSPLRPGIYQTLTGMGGTGRGGMI